MKTAAQLQSAYQKELKGREKEVWTYLVESVEEMRLEFKGRSRAVVLNPRFVDQSELDRLYADATTFGGSLLQVLRECARKPALWRGLDAQVSERELEFAAAANFEWTGLVGRLDGLPDAEGQLWFTEYNPIGEARIPDALAMMGGFCDMFREVSILEKLIGDTKLYSPDYLGPLYRELVSGPNPLQIEPLTLGLITDEMQPEEGADHGDAAAEFKGTRAEDPQAIKLIAYLFSKGVQVHFGSTKDLSLDGGQYLTLNGVPLRYVWPINHRFCYNSLDEDHPLLTSLRKGLVVPLDGYPFSELLANKAVLGAISDPSWADGAIARHAALDRVPWTRRLSKQKTSVDGVEVDLVDYALSEREQLVLKKGNGYGGQAVWLGWKEDPSSWEAAVRRAAESGDCILQKRVMLGRLPMSCVVDEQPMELEFFHDLNPYMWCHQRVESASVRVSNDDFLNLTTGTGSNTALFGVGGRD